MGDNETEELPDAAAYHVKLCICKWMMMPNKGSIFSTYICDFVVLNFVYENKKNRKCVSWKHGVRDLLSKYNENAPRLSKWSWSNLSSSRW